MEAITNFSGNWLEIAAAVYILGMILYGHYRGFIRLAVSATAMIITLIAVHVALPHVTEWLKNETPVYEIMQEKLRGAMDLDELLEQFDREDELEIEDEWLIIDELPIPDQLKRSLKEDNAASYSEMKVDRFLDYISGDITNTIMRAIIFAVLFIGIYLALRIIVIWLDLIAKLPILSGMNQLAGAILGGIQALLFIWIGCFVFTAFSGTEFGMYILKMISTSTWLSWIYDHNILSMLVMGLIRIV